MVDLLPEFPSNFAHATYIGVEPGFSDEAKSGARRGPCNETWRPFKPEFRFFVLSPGFKRWNELLSLARWYPERRRIPEDVRLTSEFVTRERHRIPSVPISFLPLSFSSKFPRSAGSKTGETERYFSGTSQMRLRLVPASEFLFSCSLGTDRGRNYEK